MSNDILDAIDEYLHGDLSRAGLEAIYYHARLQAETERRKQAEAEATYARQLLAEQIADSIREVRDLQQHNARLRRWAAAWKRAAKAQRNLASEMIQRASDLQAQCDRLCADNETLLVRLATMPPSAPDGTIVTTSASTPFAPPTLAPCPYCRATGIDGTPWASAAQRSGHIGSCPRAPRSAAKTERLPCPHCDATCTTQGMGVHIKRKHGQAALDAYRAARTRVFAEQRGQAALDVYRAIVPPEHPAWRCAVCSRPGDVIAPSIADPTRCIGCVKARKEAA
jgi:hypothetical protein